jgi:hypothetical protein
VCVWCVCALHTTPFQITHPISIESQGRALWMHKNERKTEKEKTTKEKKRRRKRYLVLADVISDLMRPKRQKVSWIGHIFFWGYVFNVGDSRLSRLSSSDSRLKLRLKQG